MALQVNVNALVEEIKKYGVPPHKGKNIVAFSGGVDSSTAAFLVHHAFPSNTTACVGVSAALPDSQLDLARRVAAFIGVPLLELPTGSHSGLKRLQGGRLTLFFFIEGEGEEENYRANQGQSCYYCKTHLYSTLEHVAKCAHEAANKVTLFNGTNKEDLTDDTRVGLVAAKEFKVHSPLQSLSKLQVLQYLLQYPMLS